MSDLTNGLGALSHATRDYDLATMYYIGNVPEVFVSTRLQRIFATSSRDFYLNYSKVCVNARLERIKVAAVTVPGDDAATALLQSAVWDFNDLLLHQKRIHETALSLGDSYVIVWPSDDGQGVKVSFNHPQGCRLIYRADDPYTPAYGIKVWHETGEVYRTNLYYADRIEKYVSVTGKSRDEQEWIEYTEEDDVWPLPNPFGQIPVFHFAANGTPYGVPVHSGTYGAQNAILKLNNLNLATAEYLGFPQRYALTDLAKSDGGTDAFIEDDFDIAVETPTSPASGGTRVQSGPGELQIFENVKSVGSFPSASPDSYLKSLEFYIDAMATTSATPLHAFKAGADAPSGEALRRAEAPLVKAIEDLIEEFTRPWSKLLSFALLCLGQPNKKVDVRFDAVASTDGLDDWQTIKAKIDAGVPRATALAEAGYTAAQITAWKVSDTSTPNIAGESAAPSAQIPQTPPGF